MRDYSDIIDLSRPKSRRPPMPLRDRAAQFSPFAALTGHGAALAEVARTTEEHKALSDDEEAALNRKMAQLREDIAKRPYVKITYFIPDALKDGGSFAIAEGNVRAIDDLERALVFTEGQRVPIRDIVSLELV